MKNKAFGAGILLFGIAAVGYVTLLWIELPDRRRSLDLKRESLKQYEFELSMLKIGQAELPFLLEKKSGATYRYILGSADSPPFWAQLQYNQFATVRGVPLTLPFPMPHGFSPGEKVPPLTAEERKWLEDTLSSRKGTRLDSLSDQPVSLESKTSDR